MKRTFFFLCLLLSVLCSSCISRMHRVAYEYPRRYEGAWLPNNSEPTDNNAAAMKLTKRLFVYECDGQWYLPVSRISYRKRTEQGGPDIPYTLTDISHADKQPYYLPISAELAVYLRTPHHCDTKQQQLTDRIQTPELLTALPPRAKAYPILRPIYSYGSEGDLLVQTESHVGPSALWAYPATALLFVADVPVTVVSSAVGGLFFGIDALLYPGEIFR